MFLAFLRLRYSSPLFRLPNAATVSAQMRLLNTGPNQASLPFFLFPLYSCRSIICHGSGNLSSMEGRSGLDMIAASCSDCQRGCHQRSHEAAETWAYPGKPLVQDS